MEYQFHSAAKGNCRVAFRTAGRHGFAAPKMFQISCLDHPEAPAVTYRYTNNVVAGVTSGELSNATLCRIAIAQFLLSPGHEQAGATQPLDTAIPPFEGAVLNAKGVVLTVGRLHSPRGMARVGKLGMSELRPAANQDCARRRHDEEPPEQARSASCESISAR